ncbi:MAG: hypothetical protein V1792_13895 [Pseudomonadota bacterium]
MLEEPLSRWCKVSRMGREDHRSGPEQRKTRKTSQASISEKNVYVPRYRPDIEALALRVLADRIEHGEQRPDLLNIRFAAA